MNFYDCVLRGYEYINENDSSCTDVNGKNDVSIKIKEKCKYSCITMSLCYTLCRDMSANILLFWWSLLTPVVLLQTHVLLKFLVRS